MGFQPVTVRLPLSFYTAIPLSNLTLSPPMQQTNFGQVEPRLPSEEDKLYPTMVVWRGRAPSLGTNVPDTPSRRYPVREGQPVGTRQIGNVTLVDYGKRDDPDGVFLRGTTSQYTDVHPRDVERRFFPQGVESTECHRIEQAVCIHSRDNYTRMVRQNGDAIGEYPFHSRLRKPSTSTHPPTDSSQASRVSSQHDPGLQCGLSRHLDNFYSDDALTVNPLNLIRDPTINDSGYDGSVSGSYSDYRRVKNKPPYNQFSNVQTGGAEPCGSFDEGLGDEMFGHTGEHFGEIGNKLWIEDK